MGDLEILRPQPGVKDRRDNMMYPPIKSRSTVKFNHKPTIPSSEIRIYAAPDSRRQTPPPRKRNTVTVASKNLVMGQVKILKRGESFEEPKIVSKQMKKITECYAGFGFADSPPPSLVPLPKFSMKNH